MNLDSAVTLNVCSYDSSYSKPQWPYLRNGAIVFAQQHTCVSASRGFSARGAGVSSSFRTLKWSSARGVSECGEEAVHK